MQPVFVPGHPELFLTKREKVWKERIQDLAPTGLIRPKLAFTVASFLRRGHRFDIDNLASPVLAVVAGEVESVWATVELGEDEGVIISEESPPPPEGIDRQVVVLRPPSRSARSSEPLVDLEGAVPLGSDEPLGLHLAFDSDDVCVGDFNFEGPIKPLIDSLAPLLGGLPHSPNDHRIQDLRIVRGMDPHGSGVGVALWFL